MRRTHKTVVSIFIVPKMTNMKELDYLQPTMRRSYDDI